MSAGRYVQLTEERTREHIRRLLRWLRDEVLSAGGDGDALWYSEYYDVKDLYPLVEEVNREEGRWEVSWWEGNISWGEGQEAVLITNDEKVYAEAPSWQQTLLRT